MLYIIALCFGISSSLVAYICLLLASCAVTLLLMESVFNKNSVSTLLFQLTAFFICWAGIFANQKEPALEKICAVIALAGVVTLILMFVYYMNTQNTKDVEERLNC